ncbi:MAG: TlpA family protein disulfide reductase [Paraburkholderia sp.]|nr:MAG: TlpA family protein disulfide reductase [Paraburkholderia sp.]
MTVNHGFRLSIGKVAAVLAVVVLLVSAYLALGRTKSVPDATFVLLSGDKLTTHDLRGKVYIVDFWATSCATCIKEMPQMIETYNKFKGPDFDFVAVSMKYDPPAYVANYTRTRQLPFKVAIDADGSLERKFSDVEMTPTTFVVDKNGRILKRILGEPDFRAFHRLIAQALAQPA